MIGSFVIGAAGPLGDFHGPKSLIYASAKTETVPTVHGHGYIGHGHGYTMPKAFSTADHVGEARRNRCPTRRWVNIDCI